MFPQSNAKEVLSTASGGKTLDSTVLIPPRATYKIVCHTHPPRLATMSSRSCLRFRLRNPSRYTSLDWTEESSDESKMEHDSLCRTLNFEVHAVTASPAKVGLSRFLCKPASAESGEESSTDPSWNRSIRFADEVGHPLESIHVVPCQSLEKDENWKPRRARIEL